MSESKKPAYPKDGLWFTNEEDRQKFDAHMRSLVTVETDDIEQDNFALKLFSPEKLQERFWTASEKFEESRLDTVNKYREGDLDHLIPRPNLSSTSFRDQHLLRKFGFWTTAYLVLRELPVKNFYARATIMWFAYWSYKNHNNRSHEASTNLLARDSYSDRKMMCFPTIYRQVLYKAQVADQPHVDEALVWGVSHKPSIGRHSNVTQLLRFLGGSDKTQVHWDGTMNMPLHRSYGFGAPVLANFNKNP